VCLSTELGLDTLSTPKVPGRKIQNVPREKQLGAGLLKVGKTSSTSQDTVGGGASSFLGDFTA
jgi:hypothetical protein